MDYQNVCDLLKNYENEKRTRFYHICHKLKDFHIKKEQMKLRGFNDFNYIDLLKGYYDENTHSKIIAQFLNPQGSHYQGDLFLTKFFEVLGESHPNSSWQVYTEYFVENCTDKGQGRIDIFLDGGEKFVIIENKVGAGDQKSQIRKYVECIRKKKTIEEPNKILVLYLTLDGKEPSDWSLDGFRVVKDKLLDENGREVARIKYISYQKGILEWIEKCIQEIENISNLREALKQYRKAVEVVTKKEENIMNLKEYLLRDENREILADLIENFEEFKDFIKEQNTECYQLFQKENVEHIFSDKPKPDCVKYELRKKVVLKIVKKLKLELENSEILKKYKLTIKDEKFKEGEKQQPLNLYKKEWVLDKIDKYEPILSFAIEFDQNHYQHILYGIKKYDENYPYKDQKFQDYPKLVEIVKNNEYMKPSNWWLVRKKFDGYYYGMWQKEFYLDVLKNGAEEIADYYVNTFVKFVEKNIDLVDKFVNEYKNNLKS